MNNQQRFALVRILFGVVWVADAWFKWIPEVRFHIIDVLTQAQAGQPLWEQAWINAWVHIASIDPIAFGTLIAIIETVLALSLITGLFSRAALYCGALFAFLIWSVPQGFGGPYAPGATDIDSGIIYMLLFIALILGEAWRRYSIAPRLMRMFKKPAL